MYKRKRDFIFYVIVCDAIFIHFMIKMARILQPDAFAIKYNIAFIVIFNLVAVWRYWKEWHSNN